MLTFTIPPPPTPVTRQRLLAIDAETRSAVIELADCLLEDPRQIAKDLNYRWDPPVMIPRPVVGLTTRFT